MIKGKPQKIAWIICIAHGKTHKFSKPQRYNYYSNISTINDFKDHILALRYRNKFFKSLNLLMSWKEYVLSTKTVKSAGYEKKQMLLPSKKFCGCLGCKDGTASSVSSGKPHLGTHLNMKFTK